MRRLLRYKTINYGVVSALEIFQQAIEGLLLGESMKALFLDKVIVTSKTQVEYKNNLREVLTWLIDTGLPLKKDRV